MPWPDFPDPPNHWALLAWDGVERLTWVGSDVANQFPIIGNQGQIVFVNPAVLGCVVPLEIGAPGGGKVPKKAGAESPLPE